MIKENMARYTHRPAVPSQCAGVQSNWGRYVHIGRGIATRQQDRQQAVAAELVQRREG
jgi:hypothetical protein